jgi:hypothetical protein
METNRVSQLDETGGTYIFLNNTSATKAAIRRFKEKGLGMSGSGIETKLLKS